MKMYEAEEETVNRASTSPFRQRRKRARPEDPKGVSRTSGATSRSYKRGRSSSCERKGSGLWDNGVPAKSPRHETRPPTEPFRDNHVERSSVDVTRQNRDDSKQECNKCKESSSEVSDPCDSEEEWILEPPRYSLSFNWRGLDEGLLRIMDESVYGEDFDFEARRTSSIFSSDASVIEDEIGGSELYVVEPDASSSSFAIGA